MVTYRQFRKIAFENNKLTKRLCRDATKSIADFNMIEEGDKVMVCVSGGKDSYCLLDILRLLQMRAPFHFDLIALHVNHKQPNFPVHIIKEYLEHTNIPYYITEEDIYATIRRVIPEGKGGCSLCARLRRGTIYKMADKLGVTKIALGHHRDDIIETFFLNLFFGAKLKSMPPKLLTDDKKHIVIRPLAYVRERDLIRYTEIRDFPLIPCTFCGPFINKERAQVKKMLATWAKEYPGRVETIFSSLFSIRPSHLLDDSFYDFKSLQKPKE